MEKKRVCITSPKKRSIEGTSLIDQNSFAILGNNIIVDLAHEMGVNVNGLQFDTVNLMKDLKIARHALDKEKCALQLDPSGPCVAEVVDKGVVPLLQWLDNDSEPESFTLVQSKKKKKS
jgi:hypothetical protein